MIEDRFDFQNIQNEDFYISLRGTAHRYFVPTDAQIKTSLKEVLSATVDSFQGIEGEWEEHDISEDYGDKRKVYAARGTDYLSDLSALFDAGAFDDIANADEHVHNIDYYFAIFRDNHGRKAIGIKKGTQLKGTLGARNRFMRVLDDSLEMVEDKVLKLDREFDAIIMDEHIFMLKVRSVEYIANIVDRVAGAAQHKVQNIHDTVEFLDLSRIRDSIQDHPRMARLAASIAARDDLDQIRQDRVEELAGYHGLVLSDVDGRLQCRRQDETKLLEILDARRYQLDLTATGPVPYRATGRQKVQN